MSAVTGTETGQAPATGVKPPLAVPRRLLRMRSDATLVERFAAGDEAAFDVIYERHRPVVLAVCMGVLGTPPDAEDATQETFSALAVTLRTRPPAELRPWLIRVARNASIDTTRRRRHRLLTLDGEIPEVAARPAGTGQAELAVVLDGIRELPEGQRMALLMRELGGHSYAEIAEFLATDEEAVKGLIARARVGLRTYREATELSCATARGTIAAEPDGRRYDKTIRRHLRGCASCRGYRDALRDDAKALRAALPIQAGTVATGSLSSGMLSAAKGSLLTYGLTQAATTCAASACAVGAIGGMVFVAPVHKLGLPPILPRTTSAAVPKHAAVRAPAHHALAPVAHTVVTVEHSAVPASRLLAGAAGLPAITHAAVVRHRHHVKVTMVSLPTLPKHHTTTPTATSPPATPATPSTIPDSNQNSQVTQGQAASTVAPSAPVSGSQTSQSSPASDSQTSQSTSSSQSASSQSSQNAGDQSSQGGTGNGSRWAGNGGSGNPYHSAGAAATGAAATSSAVGAGSASASTGTTATSTTPTTTTSHSTTPAGWGWGRSHSGAGGQSGSRHSGNWHQPTTQSTTTSQTTTSVQPSPTTTTSTPTTTPTTTPTPTTTSPTSSDGWGSGGNGSQGWGSGGGGPQGSGGNGSQGSGGNGSNGGNGWGH